VIDLKVKKLEKIIFKMFDDAIKGVDKYNHNGSLWAIFTNKMRWVVEFTKDQTLWYNYDFFEDEMKLIGLNSVEDKDLIKKWFESRFLDMPRVEDAFDPFFDQDQYVEDVIQNGVRHTAPDASTIVYAVEDTIQNGVKDISSVLYKELLSVEDTIQNGVKETLRGYRKYLEDVNEVIKDGVKETKSRWGKRNNKVNNTIQNGVKHTEDGDWLDGDERIGNIIENGVKNHQYTNKR